MERTSEHYLTFRLDDELYAIKVSEVSEVLEYERVTRLPRADEAMKGIINLRGKSVPVFDLRLRFGFAETALSKNSAIIVVELEGPEAEILKVGALVDGVEEVVEIGLGDIEAPPKMGTRLAAELIAGIAKREAKFIILVDIDAIFSSGDRESANAATEAAAVPV